MTNKTIEKVEIELLLEGILRVYGYDFRHYAKSSLKRRLSHALSVFELQNHSQLQDRILHDKNSFNEFLLMMSITVTEMFRDPLSYKFIREKVIPILKTYPFFKVWHAGCATGEEVYSMAILLHEEGLLDKATIYATDFNNSALKTAQRGIYDPTSLKTNITNYIESGGNCDFSEYYHAKYGNVKIRDFLKQKVTFANHNLVTDQVFSQMNIIFCRNVLIYFDNDLQNRVLSLFKESLCNFGFLCLGNRETIQFSSIRDDFEVINQKQKIYRKKNS